MSNIIKDAAYTKHPSFEGVFTKHLFSKEDNGMLNNLEVSIIPGFKILPHQHENSTEFMYCVAGEGDFLDDTEWRPVKKGVAFKAPPGITHAVTNTGSETLILFCTFSPATR